MRRTLSLTLLVLAAVGSGLLASQVDAQSASPANPTWTEEKSAPPRFQGEANVNEVLLDVLVTDAKGNVIVGLDKSDFVVKENGRPVDLTGVTFYSNRRFLQSEEALAKKGIDIDKVPENRYFILLFEDQKNANAEAPGLLSQQIEAGRRAKEWIEKDLLPNDYVAVASYDFKLKLQQDFTRDRAALTQAVSEAVQSKDLERNWPSRIHKEEGPSLLAALPQGNSLRDRTATIYDGLRQLALAARGIVGRKNLILFTTGFGQVTSFGQYLPDPRYYPPMMEALNGSNMAVYAVDLVPTGTQHIMASAMNQLAADTGGQYLFNFTNFINPLRKLERENNGYYLLSYQASHPGEKAGFQKVEVKASNPEFRVRTRQGYKFGEPEADKSR
ncbi:MAG TPA: VWA domain-containing protein [Thermoanaerobaculia bacterium]|nr:VWA domain-containing protein [Thermoanaerobaculia bacterium]